MLALHLILVANRQLTAVAFPGESDYVQSCHIRNEDLDPAAIPTYIRCRWHQQIIRYQSLVYWGLCVYILLCAGDSDGLSLQTREYDVGSCGQGHLHQLG